VLCPAAVKLLFFMLLFGDGFLCQFGRLALHYAAASEAFGCDAVRKLVLDNPASAKAQDNVRTLPGCMIYASRLPGLRSALP
jgi:hypothetical protein